MIRPCPACGKKNRVGAAHLAVRVRCGAGKAPLEPVAEPIDADAELFGDLLQHARVPILVDFWAAWCGPCRAVAPEVHRTAADVAGRALVVKVDTDRHPEIGARYHVQSIPNFVVLKDGRLVTQRAGLASHTDLTRMIDAALVTA